MSRDCAVVRTGADLALAAQTLDDLAGLRSALPPRSVATHEVLDMLRVAQAIVSAAMAREESRGAHTRADWPATDDSLVGRFVLVGDRAPQFVALGTTRAGSGRRRR
jgi:L-aspartate oxidase